MITLYGFGPFMGTPDSSPFVTKVMMLLKFARQPYRLVAGNPLRAPHKFLPYIEDAGAIIADSTLIRLHLESKYCIDFDAALPADQRAIAWAIEKMCENHLYFAMLETRWLNQENFETGLGRHMFGAIPRLLRPLVKSHLRRLNRQRLTGHGLGRHTHQHITQLASRDIDSVSAFLAGKPYLMGDTPTAADASIFAFITAILTPDLETPLRAAITSHTNLVDYRDRLTTQFFSTPAQP